MQTMCKARSKETNKVGLIRNNELRRDAPDADITQTFQVTAEIHQPKRQTNINAPTAPDRNVSVIHRLYVSFQWFN